MRIQTQRDTFAWRVATPLWPNKPSGSLGPIDAYDDEDEFDEDFNPIPGSPKYPMDIRREDHESPNGPWYHASDQEFKPGQILVPRRNNPDFNSFDRHNEGNHADWVWMSRQPYQAKSYMGDNDHLYEVQPHEGPWEWNYDIFSRPGDDGRYVSPRAQVVRKLQ